MKTLGLFKQQALGIFNLSIPVVLVAIIYPTFLLNTWGTMICSVFMGLYVFYLNRKATHNQANVLQYAPSSEYKESFEKSIQACKLDPSSINIRYGYSHEGIALTMFNTISIDPLLWNDSAQDPEAEKVKQILGQYTLPYLSPAQIARIVKVNEILSPAAQHFIFKHELGHIAQNYSNKKLIIVGIIGAIAAYAGITVALAIKYFGVFAVFIGMFISGIVDLLLSYASNLFFKVMQEKNADKFAAQYSSPEEVIAAADFFEKHQDILDAYRDPDNVLAQLPSTIISGHLNGKDRAHYLRQLVK